MSVSRILVVARKEFTDGFRDRRALLSVAFSAFFGPLLISFMLSQLAGQNKAAQEIQVPVVGRDRAPILVNWLAQQSGVEIVPGPSDAEAAVRDQKLDFALLIDEEFAAKFTQSWPATVRVLSDSTRQSAEPKVKRLTSLLRRFSAETGSLRLIARGVSPAVADTLKVEEISVANSQQRAATRLNVILIFLVLSVLTTGMQIATDSTAGERERGSLEPLLLNPVPRWQLAAGKWLAASAAGFAGLLATLLGTSKVLSKLPLEDLGIRFYLGMPQMLLLVAAIGPIVLLAPAVQIYLSCFARTFKEAQSYMAFLVAAVAIPGLLTTLFPMTDSSWMRPIPVLGQYTLGHQILSGKMPSPLVLIAAALEAMVLTAVLLWMTARLFSSEKIVLNRS